MIVTLFKPGVPVVWAHDFARRLGGRLVGKVINGRLRVALVKAAPSGGEEVKI